MRHSKNRWTTAALNNPVAEALHRPPPVVVSDGGDADDEGHTWKHHIGPPKKTPASC